MPVAIGLAVAFFLMFLVIGLMKSATWGAGLGLFFAGFAFLATSHDLDPNGPPIAIGLALMAIGFALLTLGDRQRSGPSRIEQRLQATTYADLRAADLVEIIHLNGWMRRHHPTLSLGDTGKVVFEGSLCLTTPAGKVGLGYKGIQVRRLDTAGDIAAREKLPRPSREIPCANCGTPITVIPGPYPFGKSRCAECRNSQ